MDIAVPSRFACLKIEDEDARPQSNKPKEVKKKLDKNKAPKKADKDAKPSDKASCAKKSSTNKSLTTTQSCTNKKEKKKQVTQQWEEWKEKDDEIVNGNYEVDLQNAILLSQLDYEHNKDLYKQTEAEEKEKAQNKKKKSKAMSLEQFLTSGKDNGSASNSGTNLKSENNAKDQNFFDNIQQEAKNALNKEQIKEKRKKREANIDEVISLAQCQAKLEKEKEKVFVLQVELEKSKRENISIKERNKNLCNILGQGEMKDKADVLLELERLYSEKNELSEEVTRLHVLLEQERSKVAVVHTNDSHNNKHKEKNKK